MGDHSVSSNVVNLMDALVWWTKAQKKSKGKTAAKRSDREALAFSEPGDGGALRHARRLTSEAALYSSNS
jgi:hypothetical protein